MPAASLNCAILLLQIARTFFFMSILRNGLILVILTIASWLYTRHRKTAKGAYPIKILQTVPRGFQVRRLHSLCGLYTDMSKFNSMLARRS